MTPARTGPNSMTIRLVRVFRAMAAVSCSGGTRRATNVRRAGAPVACTVACTMASTYSSHNWRNWA